MQVDTEAKKITMAVQDPEVRVLVMGETSSDCSS